MKITIHLFIPLALLFIAFLLIVPVLFLTFVNHQHTDKVLSFLTTIVKYVLAPVIRFLLSKKGAS